MAAITLRHRAHRVQVGFGLALQAAVAAGLAWYIARHLLSHVQPFFAPIAAIVVLAISMGQRMRRAVELVVGNAVGILLGEALVLIIGRGSWQIALVVLLALCVALFVGGSPALLTQAASSASLVVTVVMPQGDYYFSRFIDAMVGGVVGLLVMALLLPLNPLTVAQRAAGPVLDALAGGLTDTATALATRDADLAAEALARLRETETKLRTYNDDIAAAREVTTVAPIRWRSKNALQQYVDAYNHVARALRNTRVLVRRAISMITEDEASPPPLADAINEMAAAVTSLRNELAAAADPTAAREHTLAAVKLANEAHQAGVGFSGAVVVAQIRSTAIDLISATGTAPEVASRLVRQARIPGR